MHAAHEPVRVGFDNSPVAMENLRRHQKVTPQQLENRRDLLRSFDTLRRDLDSKGTIEGMDAFQDRALRMIATSKVRDAFDTVIDLSGNQTRNETIEELEQTIPIPEGGSGGNLVIVVGFEMTPAELEFNRRQRR